MAKGENKSKIIQSGGHVGYQLVHKSHVSNWQRWVQNTKLDEKYIKQAKELLKLLQNDSNIVANGKNCE